MKDFAAIDFETANGKRTSVCSVGIVIVKGGRIVNKIYRLIRPAPNYYTQWTYSRWMGTYSSYYTHILIWSPGNIITTSKT
jgi:DNA polymerase III epsilon subunit-like protein